MVHRVLTYRVSVAALIGVGFLIGADLAVSFLGQIVSWPVLLFADVCMV